MRLFQTSAFQADSSSAWSIPYNLIGDKLSSTYVWPAETNPGDSARTYVTVNKKTRIFLRREGYYERVEFDELKVGLTVEARFTGVVAPTDPVHATASEIVILQ